MSMASAVRKARATAEQLEQTDSANEANTRALVIEPVLAALGWDPSDLAQVDRDYRLSDGTSFDYALKVDGRLRVLLAAEPVGASVDDKRLVGRTVGRAAGEGVCWCVLTNGLSYRLYKADEPVGLDQRLLLAVDLAQLRDRRASEVTAQMLERLGRIRVADGDLDAWGEQLFIDGRVRAVLSTLASGRSEDLYALLEATLEGRSVSREQLGRSLERILAASTQAPVTPPAQDGIDTRVRYDIGYHTSGKLAWVIETVEHLDRVVRGLGSDVSRKVAKMSINYFAGRRAFASIKVLKRKVVVYLVLDPLQTVAENPTAMRDVTGMGHYGNGSVEYSLADPAQLPEVEQLLARAYAPTASQRLGVGVEAVSRRSKVAATPDGHGSSSMRSDDPPNTG
jgi:predicted transport protein